MKNIDSATSGQAAAGPGPLEPHLYRELFYAFEQGFCIFEYRLRFLCGPI